jgi:superfamily II DNA or RNA helicase
MTSHPGALQTIQDIKPIYWLPADPFVEEALIPAFTVSTNVDCMVGYFSSQALVSLAPGLASFINKSNGTFRLIISPVLRTADWEAIEAGIKPAEAVVDDLFSSLTMTEDLIQRYTLKCLTWLIRQERVEIQIALMKDGMFHPKVWLFRDADGDVLSAHGSSNLTHAGITRNIEQIAIAKDWTSEDSQYITQRLIGEFNALWNESNADCIVVSLPDATRERLVKTYSSTTPPQETDLSALYERAMVVESAADYSLEPKRPVFRIPARLRYKDGPFAHQGEAVKAWVEADNHGVLEMATGSGKTITAMICAYRLYERSRPLLIVVSAPYVPLIQQWREEILPFGIEPVNLSEANGPRGRAQALRRLRTRLRSGNSEVEAIIVSHSTLADEGFQNEITRFNCAKLLIADEAHNLGSEGFISNPPTVFEYKLGLSATPVRQYDDEGTEALFNFLGPVVFRYGLEEAIGNCLVEYDYFVHEVHLTDDEMDKWNEITARIRANSWRQDDSGHPDEFITSLLMQRRAILESAENKITALKEALERESLPDLKHTLVYASDKRPKQLEAINGLLKMMDVLFHQVTYEETGDRARVRRILQSFRDGSIKVITAKRVLDEGVNIPEISKAFILASTTVERQWTQRRGRLLRQCREIGKTHSEIHDFVALPPEHMMDADIRSLVASELDRVRAFANLARNAGRPDGPQITIDRLVQSAYG